MLKILENQQLAPYTTFKIGGPARYFCVVKNEPELKEAALFAKSRHLPILILGGGSNMLVSDTGFEGLAIVVDFKGWEAQDKKDHIILKVEAGEEWDKIVELAVSKGWWGIENLSHIPGKTGAIAVQNVGAYGQEASLVVEKVTVYDTKDGEIKDFAGQDCKFSYRSSIFNSEFKGRYIILQTYFKLSKIAQPNLWYRDLNIMFAGQNPSLSEIRAAVIKIRDKKFPFPTQAINGNAGSFFKNLILAGEKYEEAKIRVMDTLGNDLAGQMESKKINIHGVVKIPAALLLDICGLKGIKFKNVAINPNQPLVIVNATGKAKAGEVLELAAKILKTVKEKTGLILEIEPELIGFPSADLNLYGIIKSKKTY